MEEGQWVTLWSKLPFEKVPYRNWYHVLQFDLHPVEMVQVWKFHYKQCDEVEQFSGGVYPTHSEREIYYQTDYGSKQDVRCCDQDAI